jgi:hypothetical protein
MHYLLCTAITWSIVSTMSIDGGLQAGLESYDVQEELVLLLAGRAR